MATRKILTANTQTVCVTLRDAQKRTLVNLLSGVPAPTDGNARTAFMLSTDIVAQVLDPEQQYELARFVDSGRSALVVGNLPIVPGVEGLDPSSGHRPAGLPPLADALQLGILGQAGHVVAYADEHDGRALHEIAPANDKVARPRKSQLKERLEAHSDRARFDDDAQCDILSLFALRNPQLVATEFMAAIDALSRVDEDLQPLLFEPRYEFGKDGRFEGKRPILRWVDGRLIVCLPPETLPCDARAMRAQDALRAAVVPGGVVLEPGMMLLLSNRSCLHWRSEINAPTRWLRRAYGVLPDKFATLRAQRRVVPNSFIVTP